jgi:hypothetical protein
MKLSYLSALLAMLLFCPVVTHADVTPVPAPDVLASQCQQLEGAHGPTREYPNTYYANLVFQCASNPGTAPAGIVFKAIEQYAKSLAQSDARSGTCSITMANGGANTMSQGPMTPYEASAATSVVISYNAKYACLGGTPIRTSRYEARRYAPEQPLMAAVPMQDGYGYYEERRVSFTQSQHAAEYTPPRPSWIARDEMYNNRHHYLKHKATYRVAKPSVRKNAKAERKTSIKQPKIEVKTTTVTKVTPATPAPAPIQIKPSNGLTAPAPTSPLPGFVSP